jgi:RsiW-degrading membrane proteinase PrsW (M82 family)
MNVEETGLVESAGPDGSRWSDRAVQRLAQARVLSVLAVAIGAALFAVGEASNSMLSNFLSSAGLTLATAGGVLFVAAGRTRRIAPDQAFAPQTITAPRMWFVLLWLGGLAAAAILSALGTPDVVNQLIMLVLALMTMTAGCLWAVRWISGQRAKLWPVHSELVLKWVPAWTVLWSTVWGAFSTFLAVVIEATPLLLVGLLVGRALEEVPQTRLNSYEGLEQAILNPAVLALLFAGAVIGAPVVEEALKAVGLRGLRRWIQRPADGWLLGFAAGLGFGLLEGAFNLDTTDNWFMGGWLRLAALLLHGLATSLTGLGYARYLQTRQRGELWRGYWHAVLMHGLWNASALAIAFLGVSVGLSVFTLNVLLICFVGVLIVGAVVLMVLMLRRVATAGVQSSIQEDHQQAGVPLPGDWQPMRFNIGWRLVGRRPIVASTVMAGDPAVSLNGPASLPIDDAHPPRNDDAMKVE